ncbi:hypothetical protein OYT1_ch2348 [Ferriphaselus amnicola]|uniref:Uncharacterized protein n=2 Tax=Ferriphaselus amnicola TaxID=1188319 RepID=A0A2Z6GE16_9PROT|nr:hypothetical protein OYT1_ch2348 [Ferriphaselus amnicola]
MTLNRWQAEIDLKNPEFIRASVNFMEPRNFIDLLGKENFIRKWGDFRKEDRLFEDKKAILDGAWSLYVVGDIGFRVVPEIALYPKKKLATLRLLVASNGDLNIYQIAKQLGRSYHRVHDDVVSFMAGGLD